jgi:hypothetical protein
MIMLFALAAPLFVLPLTAIAVSTSAGLSGLTTTRVRTVLPTFSLPILPASPTMGKLLRV